MQPFFQSSRVQYIRLRLWHRRPAVSKGIWVGFLLPYLMNTIFRCTVLIDLLNTPHWLCQTASTEPHVYLHGHFCKDVVGLHNSAEVEDHWVVCPLRVIMPSMTYSRCHLGIVKRRIVHVAITSDMLCVIHRILTIIPCSISFNSNLEVTIKLFNVSYDIHGTFM